MSPSGQSNASSQRRNVAPPTSMPPTFQAKRKDRRPNAAANKRRDFDPHAFLATIGEGRKSVLFRRKRGIFAQGDTADAVFYFRQAK